VESNSEIIGAKPRPAASTPDISVFRCSADELKRAVHDPALVAPTSEFDTHVMPDGSRLLCVFNVCAIHVCSDGRTVRWTSWVEEPEPPQTYLLSAGLSYCLLAKGIEPLHGTAVEVGGRALVLLGDSGHGKSTLAAGFMAAGYRLMSDDVLVL